MDRHITVISDLPEYQVFEIVLSGESKNLGFTYTLTKGAEADRCLEEIERSDAIIVCSNDLSNDVINAVRNSQACFVFSNSEELLRGNAGFLQKAEEYFARGGIQNIYSLVRLSLWVCGENITFPDVLEVPWHGIYHPRAGVFQDLSKYLWDYPFSIFPAAGLLFSRRKWLYGQAKEAMNVISGLESKRFGVIPVFTQDEGEHVSVSEVGKYFSRTGVIINFSGLKPEELMEFGIPVLDCSSDRIRVYHPLIPGFSEKSDFSEENIVELAVKWMKLSEKRLEDVVVGVYPDLKLFKYSGRPPFRVVSAEENEEFDLILDYSGKCEIESVARLTPD